MSDKVEYHLLWAEHYRKHSEKIIYPAHHRQLLKLWADVSRDKAEKLIAARDRDRALKKFTPRSIRYSSNGLAMEVALVKIKDGVSLYSLPAGTMGIVQSVYDTLDLPCGWIHWADGSQSGPLDLSNLDYLGRLVVNQQEDG